MARANYLIDSALFDYLTQVAVKEPDVIADVRAKTVGMTGWGKMLTPDSAHFLRFLVAMTGSQRCLDIGTFTGMSAISMAITVSQGGMVHTCESSEKYSKIAQDNINSAGVSDRVTMHLGPALTALDQLEQAYGKGYFDFVFIDADKANMEAYYQRALSLVKTNGIIVMDNVFWYKQILDESCKDQSTQAVRLFNLKRSALADTKMVMVPLGDGLMLIRADAEVKRLAAS